MKTKILMVALMLLAMTPAIQAKSSTKTVAHRGYWKCEGSAENSLTSLRKAHDVGCWGVGIGYMVDFGRWVGGKP